MLNQVDPVKEVEKALSFFASVAMKSPWAIKIWDIHSLFMAVCEGFGKTLHKTPSKKGPFFWFVFFGPTKKMNKTIGLNGVSPIKGLLDIQQILCFYLKNVLDTISLGHIHPASCILKSKTCE